MNQDTNQPVWVIGAGLAGCEAAWTLAQQGIAVRLYEMKPQQYTPAHQYKGFAELICSNSLKAARIGSAAGMLKEEMRILGSLTMEPQQYTPAHQYKGFAELICSNSLKAARIGSAAGMLKEEMRILGSLTMEAAQQTSVSAGGALAVDRERFSDFITERILAHPLIEVVHQRVDHLPEGTGIVASGPLTEEHLAQDIAQLCGESYLSFFDAAAPIVTFESLDKDKVFFAARYGRGEEEHLAQDIAQLCGESYLSFFDAAAPIVTFESLDKDKVFFAARYGRGEDDYINCPMDKEQYEAFYEQLVQAESVQLHSFEREQMKVYEGCMPVEVMAKRGADTLRYGPLKPVGLTDPHTGRRPWAVVQLRSENRQGSLYNLVGFQTNLKFPEQKRVFSMIPGLEQAEFVRYGVMHRNTFLDSPRLLESDLSLKKRPDRWIKSSTRRFTNSWCRQNRCSCTALNENR